MSEINVELFSCSGGAAEGARRAGVHFDRVFDKDADACASYTHNLGHAPIRMDVSDLLRMVEGGWRLTPIRLFVADPPCTPWSRAGKRQGVEDERDMLTETARLIELLRPRAWLIANVPGLDDADHWKSTVQPVIGGMARRGGYCVDYASLDAADFGVPQRRIRPLWYGHAVGTPCVHWPSPSHCKPPVLLGLGIKPWVTCREALSELSAEELGRPIKLRYRGGEGVGKKARASELDTPAGVVTAHEGSGDGCTLAVPHERHPISKLDAPSFTIKTNGGRASQASSTLDLTERLPDPNRPPVSVDEPFRTVTKASESQALIEWQWDRSALTVTADPNGRIGAPGRHGKSSLSQPDAVVLSERAAAILQGFPDGWHFAGATKRTRWSQIGQAMPPPLMEAVVRQIAKQLASSAAPAKKSRVAR